MYTCSYNRPIQRVLIFMAFSAVIYRIILHKVKYPLNKSEIWKKNRRKFNDVDVEYGIYVTPGLTWIGWNLSLSWDRILKIFSLVLRTRKYTKILSHWWYEFHPIQRPTIDYPLFLTYIWQIQSWHMGTLELDFFLKDVEYGMHFTCETVFLKI